jgi:diguanylate cyclase (GGDEF)-like protein
VKSKSPRNCDFTRERAGKIANERESLILMAMKLVPPPKLLLLLKDAQIAQSVDELWGPYDAMVLLEGGAATADDVDLIVTDLPLIEAALASGRAPGELTSPAEERTLGVITLGDVHWGDVALAADYSDRELRLACMLLCNLMRTRRQRNENAAQANVDSLTGVPNRRAWDQRLGEIANQSGVCCTLGIADLDDFRRINRESGIAIGDSVLARAAGAMHGSLQAGEFLARLGGDEFGVLLQTADEVEAAAALERIRTAVAQLPGEGAPFTLSVGYVQTSGGPVDPRQLVAAADFALRQAKLAGGDRVVRETIAALD